MSSRTAVAGTTLRAHLALPLQIGDVEVAPAGTPARIEIVGARAARAPDVDGTLQIKVAPLDLAGRGSLPLRPAHEFWTIELTTGQRSTNALEDSAKDIFIPGHFIYRFFRRGRDLELRRGTLVRVQTLASLELRPDGTPVVATPPPFLLGTDQPHSDFAPRALATPQPKPTRTPKP